MKIALIGRGHWGKNIERILKTQPVDYEVFDKSEGRTIDDVKDFDACIIATPADTHYEIAAKALNKGMHCLIEKPMAKTVQDATAICELAKLHKKIVMVGHQFLYNGAVIKLKELIKNGTLGKIYYMYSQRLKLGKVRDDVDTLWNFAPHDISIFNYLLDSTPISVSCQGWEYIKKGKCDVAFLTLNYPNNINCHIHVSWLDLNRVRKIVVAGSKNTVIFDDMIEDSFKLSLVNEKEFAMVDHSLLEPLYKSILTFIVAIESGTQPVSDCESGLEVVKVLQSAQQSMSNNGEVRKV
jgi:predicted dehydrogenase